MKNIILAMTLFASAAISSAARVFDAPDGGEVVVDVLKHASLRIRWNGLEIHVDPVGAAMPPVVDYAAFPKADLVLVTHEHFDHFDRDAIEALRGGETLVAANPSVHGMLGWGRALANGEWLEWRGIVVEAVPARNTTPGREKFHPAGRDNGYVLTLGGLRLYVAGDTEPLPEMAELGGIDVAFLPCNQPYTMTPGQLAEAVRLVKPKTVIPYHLGDTDRGSIAAALEGLPVRVAGGL